MPPSHYGVHLKRVESFQRCTLATGHYDRFSSKQMESRLNSSTLFFGGGAPPIGAVSVHMHVLVSGRNSDNPSCYRILVAFFVVSSGHTQTCLPAPQTSTNPSYTSAIAEWIGLIRYLLVSTREIHWAQVSIVLFFVFFSFVSPT